jgi:hypothetical protein
MLGHFLYYLTAWQEDESKFVYWLFASRVRYYLNSSLACLRAEWRLHPKERLLALLCVTLLTVMRYVRSYTGVSRRVTLNPGYSSGASPKHWTMLPRTKLLCGPAHLLLFCIKSIQYSLSVTYNSVR